MTIQSLFGRLAQLGERQNRTLEVGGSTPLPSTRGKNTAVAVLTSILITLAES